MYNVTFLLIVEHIFSGLVTDYRVSDVINNHICLVSSWTNKKPVEAAVSQSPSLFFFCPAALADSTRKKIPFLKNVVCLPSIRAPRPAGLHTQGGRQIIFYTLSTVHRTPVFSKLLFSKTWQLNLYSVCIIAFSLCLDVSYIM